MCEDCGYALKGLKPDGGCPECGHPIAESSPALRTGPSWQDRMTASALFQVVADLTLRPKRFFRTLRVDGTNARARMFLVLVAGLIGLGWSAMGQALYPGGIASRLISGALVALSVILLSYIEALGVTFFSRRRDWRVPLKLAERLVCYASIGWLPAAAAMALASWPLKDGTLERWMLGVLGIWGPWQTIALLMLVGSVAMMWFEVLVWTGVRQTKHANWRTY